MDGNFLLHLMAAVYSSGALNFEGIGRIFLLAGPALFFLATWHPLLSSASSFLC